MAYRSLLRNKFSSSINLVGLSVAIGCCIIFFLMLDMEYTSDRFHENVKNTFMVVYTLEGDQRFERWGDSPQPLGPALETDLPQVERAVRVTDQNCAMRYGDNVFNESIRFVDPDFLELFTFLLRLGDRMALFDKNSLIFSEEMAEKYFGEENPVGKQVMVQFHNKVRKTLVVGGVAEKFPDNASFGFHALASYENLDEIGERHFDDWGTFVRATFIQVGSPEDISVISAQMDRYVQRHNAARVDRPIASFGFEPLSTLSWESQEIRRSISSGSTPEALILLFVIGLFLLLQACFNYVNIALAYGTRRLKEIGIRKVVGSQRLQLIVQFLAENLLLCFLALIGGFLLAEVILLPGFMKITGEPDRVSLLDFFSNAHFWVFLFGLLLLTGVGGGAYPALIISRQQPVGILKDTLRKISKKKLSSLLLSVQFGITFIIICLVVTFLQNNQYQLKRDWGYNKEHVINIRLDKGEQFDVLKNRFALNPNVIQIAGMRHSIGRSQGQAVVDVDANKHEVISFEVGPNYLDVLGLRLREGRLFRLNLSTDREAALVVNERFVEEMGWQHAMDQPVRYQNRLYKVIGIVEDFHYESFFEEIKPAIFRLVDTQAFLYLAARVKAGTGVETAKEFREIWRSVFLDSPYEGFFQDSVFEIAFRNNVTITQIFTATACITLTISCMGLFGLVTLIISKRTKELGVRKVLGASVIQIARLISRRFVLLVLISILVMVPGCYLFINILLDGVYKYHMALGASPFILAAMVVLVTAILTIVSQVYKAAVRNPIDAIRYE